MTYTETQLEAIKIFGRKDLTEGCVILEEEMQRHFTVAGVGEVKMYGNPIWIMDGGIPKGPYKWNFEILGHIPHLEDLFGVAISKGYNIWVNDDTVCLNTPMTSEALDYNPTLPLLDQPSLPEIISLFK